MSRDLTTQYRAFSLTWPASLQIYWNKRKRLHKKDCNSHRIVSELKHGRRFIVLELQYCRDDVMRKTPCLYFKMNKLCVANFDSVQSSMLKLLQFSAFLFLLCFQLLLVRNIVNWFMVNKSFSEAFWLLPSVGFIAIYNLAMVLTFELLLTGGARWRRVAPVHVARVQILLLTPYVGWVNLRSGSIFVLLCK